MPKNVSIGAIHFGVTQQSKLMTMKVFDKEERRIKEMKCKRYKVTQVKTVELAEYEQIVSVDVEVYGK